MDDQTRIIDDGTAIYPMDPAAATVPEACPHCQTPIPAGEQFCPACGYQRDTWMENGAAASEDAPVEAAAAVDARFALVAADGASYPLPDGETVAGRSEGAGIVIPDGYISRRHARFVVDGDAVSVCDLGSANGTFIDEQRLDAETVHELSAAVNLRLGQTGLRLQAIEPAAEEPGAEAEEPPVEATVEAGPPDAAADSPAAEPAEDAGADKPGLLADANVEVTAAPSPWSLARIGEDEVFYLPYGASELGRKAGKCDIVVRGDGYISGKHARALASIGNLVIIDLGSTNGTYVNSERVAPDQVRELSVGDTVRLGQTDMTVVFETPAAVDEPTDEEPVQPEPEAAPADEPPVENE